MDTQLKVIRIFKTILHCDILTINKKDDTVHISSTTFNTNSSIDMPLILKRLQFLVRLAFAITIDKSQGQSFDKIGLFLACKYDIHSLVAFIGCESRARIRIKY